MDVTFKLDDASLDAIATEVTKRVLAQLGRANDEIPVTKDAPVMAATIEDEDPTMEIGKINQSYTLADLRPLAHQFFAAKGSGARDMLKGILKNAGAHSLSSLDESKYGDVAEAMLFEIHEN